MRKPWPRPWNQTPSDSSAQQPTDEDGDTVMSVVERLEDEVCAPLTSIEHEELMAVHEALEGRRPDVAEVYSPPRITAEAKRMHLRPGFALDFTVFDEFGERWDFRRTDHRQRARLGQDAKAVAISRKSTVHLVQPDAKT